MEIRGFLENSFIDYPGKVSSVIFTYGCNLRCSWCHSPSLVTKSKFFLKKYTLNQVINRINKINKYQKWIDAIVICGGEPTMQNDLIKSLCKIRIHLSDVLIKLDTNGTNATQLKQALRYKLVDYIAMDIKPLQIGRDKYMECIDIVKNSGIDYEFRMTCAPTEVNDNNIDEILKPFKYSKRLVFQNFSNKNKMIDKSMNQIKPYKLAKLEAWKVKFKKQFDEIIVR